MYKPSFPYILLCLFVKYMAFFLYFAIQDNRFKILVINKSESGQELFMNSVGYFLYVLAFVVFLMLIFSIPIFFLLKVKNGIYFILLMVVIFMVEYFLYTYLASQGDLINGIYNGIIGLLFLLLFFYKHINSIFKRSL